MAEFCLDCWNRMNGTKDPSFMYIMSKNLELCEGCGEYRHIIVTKRRHYYERKLQCIIVPFKKIYRAVYILWRILILPYLMYKLWRDHKKQS